MITPPTQLPTSPWIYQFFDHKGQLLYIWKAKNIAKRVQQYFTPWSLWKQEMISSAGRVEWIETPSEADALLLEDNLIKTHLPEYNKLLRNNSSYVFLKISKGDFPTFRIVKKRTNDGSTYIWPRYNSKQLREILRYLRKVLKFHIMKTREFAAWTLHSDYFFWLDKWWNIVAILNDPKKQSLVEQAKRQWRKQEKSYEEYFQEYKQIVSIVRQCFEWKTKPVIDVLMNEINQAIEKQHFERCAILRDMLMFVQALDTTYQHIVLQTTQSWYITHLELCAESWVCIIAQITDWKVVDLIRTHVSSEDNTANNIMASLAAEFWCTQVLKDNKNSYLITSSTLAKITKKEIKTLETLFLPAQKSYLQTTAQLHENNIMDQLLLQIKQYYALNNIPLHMECIDISHHGWDQISGWLSCFRWWIPDKTLYRNYKITTVKNWSSDDYQSLKEVILRRFKITKNGIGTHLLPDLLIIDWGKWQLGVIRELAKEYPAVKELMNRIDIVALGKGEARQRSKKLTWAPEIIYKFWPDRTIQEYGMSYDHADQLLINLRDEAHRFANKYRKKQAEMNWK